LDLTLKTVEKLMYSAVTQNQVWWYYTECKELGVLYRDVFDWGDVVVISCIFGVFDFRMNKMDV